MRNFSPEMTRRLIQANTVILGLLFLLALLFGLTNYLFEICVLLGACIICTYVLLGPVDLLESLLSHGIKLLPKPISMYGRWLPSRPIAILMVYCCLALVSALFFIQVAPGLYGQLQELEQELPRYYKRTLASINSFEIKNPWLFENKPVSPKGPKPVPIKEETAPKIILKPKGPIPEKIIHPTVLVPPSHRKPEEKNLRTPKGKSHTTIVEGVTTAVKGLGESALGYMVSLGSMTLMSLLYTLTGLVIVFYLLLDGKSVRDGFLSLLPHPWVAPTIDFLARSHTLMYRFLQGQIILSAIAGVFLFSVLFLFQAKFVGFLAFFYGLTSIVPVIGPWVGLIPSVAVLMFGENPEVLTPFLLVVGMFYIFKENVLLPRLLPQNLDIHPITVILSLMLCLRIGGPIGLILAFPVAALLSIVLHYIQQHELPSTTPLFAKTSGEKEALKPG